MNPSNERMVTPPLRFLDTITPLSCRYVRRRRRLLVCKWAWAQDPTQQRQKRSVKLTPVKHTPKKKKNPFNSAVKFLVRIYVPYSFLDHWCLFTITLINTGPYLDHPQEEFREMSKSMSANMIGLMWQITKMDIISTLIGAWFVMWIYLLSF